MQSQLSFFDAPTGLPDGFRHADGLISAQEETRLLDALKALPFKEFEFHGFLGKRRVVSFGWQYDFSSSKLRQAEPLPAFLLAARDCAAEFAGLPASALEHALVTEYQPGTSIGWHRDKGAFGEVIGISLLSTCVFRLRRKQGSGWQRASIRLEPRSVYLLSGPSRSEWEHSIPAVGSLRYSITFRTLSERSPG